MIQLLLAMLTSAVFAREMLLKEARNLVQVVPYTGLERTEIAKDIIHIAQAVFIIN